MLFLKSVVAYMYLVRIHIQLVLKERTPQQLSLPAFSQNVRLDDHVTDRPHNNRNRWTTWGRRRWVTVACSSSQSFGQRPPGDSTSHLLPLRPWRRRVIGCSANCWPADHRHLSHTSLISDASGQSVQRHAFIFILKSFLVSAVLLHTTYLGFALSSCKS